MVATYEEVLKDVLDILNADYRAPVEPEVEENDDLNESLAFDTLDRVELVMSLETVWPIEITDEEVESLVSGKEGAFTPKAIAEFVVQKLGNS